MHSGPEVDKSVLNCTLSMQRFKTLLNFEIFRSWDDYSSVQLFRPQQICLAHCACMTHSNFDHYKKKRGMSNYALIPA